MPPKKDSKKKDTDSYKIPSITEESTVEKDYSKSTESSTSPSKKWWYGLIFAVIIILIILLLIFFFVHTNCTECSQDSGIISKQCQTLFELAKNGKISCFG